MKPVAEFCFVLVVMAMVGSSTADEEACSLPPGASSRSTIISQLLNRCMVESNGTDVQREVVKGLSIDELRPIFKNHCEHLEEIHRCTTEISTLSEDCLGATHHENFKTKRDLFKAMLEEGCAQSGGESIAVLFGAMNEHHTATGRNFVSTCWSSDLLDGGYDEADPVALKTRLYTHVGKFEVCLNSFEFGDKRMQDLVRNDATPVLVEVLKKMECDDPEHPGTLVRCEKKDAVAA